jgi:hypothetical protein
MPSGQLSGSMGRPAALKRLRVPKRILYSILFRMRLWVRCRKPEWRMDYQTKMKKTATQMGAR